MVLRWISKFTFALLCRNWISFHYFGIPENILAMSAIVIVEECEEAMSCMKILFGIKHLDCDLYLSNIFSRNMADIQTGYIPSCHLFQPLHLSRAMGRIQARTIIDLKKPHSVNEPCVWCLRVDDPLLF